MEQKDTAKPSVQTFQRKTPQPWWLIPMMAVGLSAIGLWQILQCLAASKHCKWSNFDPLWGPFALFVGLAASSYLIRQLRMNNSFGNVTLRLESGPAIKGQPLNLSLLVEKTLPSEVLVSISLQRQDKTVADHEVATARGTKHFSAVLNLPSDLKILRASGGSSASFIVVVESEKNGTFDWRSIVKSNNLVKGIGSTGDWFKYNLTGPLGLNYEFEIPWQNDDGSFQPSIAENTDKSHWDKANPLSSRGRLSSGAQWKTKNKENESYRGNWTSGSFRWEADDLPIPKIFEFHLLSRNRYLNALEKVNGINESKTGLNQLSAHMLTLADKNNNEPLILAARKDLLLCPVANDEFEERYALLTNDVARAQSTFNETIAIKMLEFAEKETSHLTVALQDSSLTVEISQFDFSPAVADKWTALSVNLAERLLH